MSGQVSSEEKTQKSRLFWGWLPLEAVILVAAGVFFHFMAQVHWERIWEGFIYDQVLRWHLPVVFFLAAGYSVLAALKPVQLGKKMSFFPPIFLEFLLSLGAVLYVKYWDPIMHVDDVGFILRYLDHFREGCFFCFNPEDGPVFGISSFVYGLVAGVISWTHILSPEKTLSFLTYLGIFGTAFLSFRILRTLFSTSGTIVLLWFLVMTCNRSIAVIFNSGMEAPLHYSIILAAFYFFLKKNDRMMWLFMALTVISKLDAVPLVLVISVFWLLENWKELLKISWKNPVYRNGLLFGLLPVVIWIAFAELVFGSPLPQSAFAKIHFHHHAKGSWFPFLDGFTWSAYRAPFFYTMLVLLIAQTGYVAAKGKGGRSLVFGFAFVATLVLYFYYNPGERMAWYYVMPEGLMMLSLAVGVHWFWRWLGKDWRLIGISIATGSAFMFTWIHLTGDVEYMRIYERVVEGERQRIGEYLGNAGKENENLLAGHGLIGRHFKGIVIDQTGLNSRIITQMGRNDQMAWDSLKPDWIVMHGFHWEVNKLNEYPYSLDTSFYDITTYQYPTWRVFRRAPDMEFSAGTYYLRPERIPGDEVELIDEAQKFLHLRANAFTIIREDYNRREEKISFGIRRHEFPFKMIVKDVMPGDTTVWKKTYEIPGYGGPGSPPTYSVTIPLLRTGIRTDLLPGERKIMFSFEESYGKVTIYDPVISVLRRDP